MKSSAKPTRLEIYSMYMAGRATLEQTATSLGFTPGGFRIILARAKEEMPKRLAVLDEIDAGRMKNAEACKVLGCSVRNLSALMKNWGVERPMAMEGIDDVLIEIKQGLQIKYALEVIRKPYVKGEMVEFLDDMADKAGISSRQLRREVTDLLRRHVQLEYTDLTSMNEKQRNAVADQIEEAEHRDAQHVKVIEQVASGIRRREEAAIELAYARRKEGKLRRCLLTKKSPESTSPKPRKSLSA
jgi:hypothetical protein